ncbi:MAG: hypothetical protein OEY79_02125 [Anaplasmataceae bacterium]|nr:hypothetical protein [Anaplasmataceae bacterium]
MAKAAKTALNKKLIASAKRNYNGRSIVPCMFINKRKNTKRIVAMFSDNGLPVYPGEVAGDNEGDSDPINWSDMQFDKV